MEMPLPASLLKEKILELFLSGKTIDELSIEFSCTKLTITRNIKKTFGISF